jgi:hypothetical protein
MTKKELNTQSVINELRGQSAFFKSTPPFTLSPDKSDTEEKRASGKGQTKKPKVTRKSGHRGVTTPSNHATTVSRYHDAIIETVRKAVKELGKEAATHRFTIEEKKAVADIIYAYKNQGTRTSENEITRIAVNFIVDDYRENGENSILDKVLKALNR